MTRLYHYDRLETARFVTFSCYQRRKLLKSGLELSIVSSHINRLREKLGFRIHGFVLMPEHVHLVVTPPKDSKLGVEIGRMKARSAMEILSHWRSMEHYIPERSARKIHNAGQPVFWHRRCYDHNCRSIETVREKIQYCHNNPVKRELVKEPRDWKYSSYNWYLGERDVPILIDPIEL